MFQTGLTVDEVIQEIDSGSNLPLCLLVNELGEFAKQGEEKALQKLKDFLDHNSANVRFAAYCFLKYLAPSHEVVRDFESKSENQPFVDEYTVRMR